MRKIVIIGNSAAGLSAARTLRENDKDAQITVVTDEPFLGYERHKVLGFFDGSLSERDLSFRGKNFYADFRIELIREKRVTGVSVHRRHVHFKEKETLGFDDLVIATGRRPALLPLKGVQKEGVVAFGGLVEAKFILDNLPIAHTVLVVGDTKIAVELARMLAARQVDVKFFTDTDTLVEGAEVIRDNPIIEVLGDSGIKAVRLSSQKVVGASLLVLAGPREPNVDFVRETDIKINQGVCVDATFRTRVPYIFAVGDVAEPQEGAWQEGWEPACRQGEQLGGFLCQV